MEQKEADLAVIEQWSRKCYEYSSESNDPLLSLLAKGLDTIAVLASSTSDSASILRSLQSLELELMAANQYDNKDVDPLRLFSYGFIESFNLLIKMQRENKNEQLLPINMNDQITNFSPSANCLAKEEPYDDYYYDDEMFNVNPQFPMEPKVEPVDSLEANGNQISENIACVSIIDDSEDIEEEKNSDHATDAPENTSNKTVEVKKRKLPPRNVSKPTNLADSLEDSGDDLEVELNKKPRLSSQKKYDKKRTSVDMNGDPSMATKKPHVARVNKTELECPSCVFRTRSVPSLLDHLYVKHSTTPRAAGLALLCECGHKSFSNDHLIKCNIANFTIIREENVTPKTPQCIFCEAYPKTAWGYVYHLANHHKSTLKKNNIYLKCSCGVDVRCQVHGGIEHGKNCDPHLFTLHKLEVD